jgi:hypothetical protein
LFAFVCRKSIKKEIDVSLSSQHPSTSAANREDSPIPHQGNTKLLALDKQFLSCPHHAQCPALSPIQTKPSKKNKCFSCCHDSSDEEKEVVKTTSQPTQTEPSKSTTEIQVATPYSRYDFECKHGTHAMKVYRYRNKAENKKVSIEKYSTIVIRFTHSILQKKKKQKSGCCGKQPVSDSSD